MVEVNTRCEVEIYVVRWEIGDIGYRMELDFLDFLERVDGGALLGMTGDYMLVIQRMMLVCL